MVELEGSRRTVIRLVLHDSCGWKIKDFSQYVPNTSPSVNIDRNVDAKTNPPDFLFYFRISVIPIPYTDNVLTLPHTDRAPTNFGPLAYPRTIAIVTPAPGILTLNLSHFALGKLIPDNC